MKPKNSAAILSFCLLLLCQSELFAQVPDFDWVRNAGVGQAVSHNKNEVIQTQDGGAVFAICFQGSIDADPGPGVVTVTGSANYLNVVLIKLDAAGNTLWHKSFPSSIEIQTYSLAEDANGNLYLTGYCDGTVDFDPGPGTHIVTVDNAGFLLKLTSAGDFEWVDTFGETSISTYISGLDIDPQGNAVIYGSYFDTLDLDPGPGTYPIVANAIQSDFFVAKYTSSGSFVWGKTFGGISADVSRRMAMDASGNIFIAGWFSGSADLDPSAGTAIFTQNPGEPVAFIAKYDGQGAYLWCRLISSNLSLDMFDLAVDANGSVHGSGRFSGQMDIDPTAGVQLEQGNSTIAAYSLALDASGAFQWGKTWGTNSGQYMEAFALALDPQGNTYLAGEAYASDSVDMDPGPASAWINANGNGFGYILKLDQSGTFEWSAAFHAGVGNGSSVRCMSVTPSGALYTGGYFNGTTDFNPGPFQMPVTAVSNFDVFFHRMEQVAVGIDQPISGFRVYPNPVQELLNVDAPAGEAMLRILDLQGRVLCVGHGNSLDLHGLPAGMYILEVLSEGSSQKTRFQKMR